MKAFFEEHGKAIIVIIAIAAIIGLIVFFKPQITNSFGGIFNGMSGHSNNLVGNLDVDSIDFKMDDIDSPYASGDFSSAGNIVNINGKRYRILAVNGYEVKVVSLDSYGSSTFSSSDSYTVDFGGGKIGQKYEGSTLDNAMNNIYNSFPEQVKKAIVEQNIHQSMYDRASGTSPEASFSAFYANSFNASTSSGNNYYLTKIGSVNVGLRKVYALDVDDVIAYLGTSSTPQDVNEMIIGEMNPKNRSIWLRSARYNDGTTSFYIKGSQGRVTSNGRSDSCLLRPAFVINVFTLVKGK